MAESQPSISVVVASCNSPRTLRLCLQSLESQGADEVIVVDCSSRDPAVEMGPRFPDVQFVHSRRLLRVPEMRREGIRRSRGDLIALTESWMVPSPGWVAALRECHRKNPSAGVVGGSVDFPLPGTSPGALAWADYFSEYGHHRPLEQGSSSGGQGASDSQTHDIPDSSAPELTGANCCYRRSALEACDEFVEQAAWEPFLHECLRRRGFGLRRAWRAVVTYDSKVSAGGVLRQRFQHGRGFGAARGRQAGWVRRIGRAAASPAVPWVMLARLARAGHTRRWGTFLRASPWLLALYYAWAIGEGCGYLFGGGPEG